MWRNASAGGDEDFLNYNLVQALRQSMGFHFLA